MDVHPAWLATDRTMPRLDVVVEYHVGPARP
jgi:hypothetical protein